MKFRAAAYILFTRDVGRLAAFYERAFGFKRKKNPHYGEASWLELEAGRGFRLCLHRSAEAPGRVGSRQGKLVLHVADVAEARDDLRKAGVKLGSHKRWPSGDACDGRDPDGNVFQLLGPSTLAG